MHERNLTRAIQVFLGFLVLGRIALKWRVVNFCDLRYFIVTANQILQGISPYHPENNPPPYLYPLQPPSMSLLSMPLCFTPELFQELFFFIGNSLFFFAYTFMVFDYYGFSPKRILEARWCNLPIWITLTLIFISSPFLTVIVQGQDSCFVCFFLFWVLFYPKYDKGVNIVFLALAAAMKYSLLTMLVPVLIFQKRWRVSILSMIVFLAMVLSVGLWLNGIIPALIDYINLVITETQKGYNSHSGKISLSLVDIGFFRYQFLNTIIKVSLLVLYFLTLRKIWRRGRKESDADNARGFWVFPERLTAIEWASFTMLTMVISYHRNYDCLLFLPFVGVVFIEVLNQAYDQSKFKGVNLVYLIGLAAILLYWSAPQSSVYKLEYVMGSLFPLGRKLVYYTCYQPLQIYDVSFPFTKIFMMISVFFLFAMVLSPFFDNQIRKNKED